MVNIKVIKVILFLAIFIALFCAVSWFFSPPCQRNSVIYYEPKNSVDVLFVGSSHIFSGINPVILWREEGIAAFNYVSNNQPPWTTYHYLIEALKTQKPRLVIIDVWGASMEYPTGYQANQQNVLNTFNTSFNKLALANSSVKEGQRVSAMADLLFYHTRWRDVPNPTSKKRYLDVNFRKYKGYTRNGRFLIAELSSELNDIVYPSTDEIGEIHEKCTYYLLKIIELSNKNDFELIFIKTPVSTVLNNEVEVASYNAVKNIAEENKIRFIDYNENHHRNAMKFDFTTDLLDKTHLNDSGATKLSKYIAKFIKSEYVIPDRRGNSRYISWDELAEEYFSQIASGTVDTEID